MNDRMRTSDTNTVNETRISASALTFPIVIMLLSTCIAVSPDVQVQKSTDDFNIQQEVAVKITENAKLNGKQSTKEKTNDLNAISQLLHQEQSVQLEVLPIQLKRIVHEIAISHFRNNSRNRILLCGKLP